MRAKKFHYDRLVKSEDLNHHRTLFAGRGAEWFIEAGFIAVASVLPADTIVCYKVHGMTFSKPIHPGEIACFESQIVKVGRTSLAVYVSLHTLKHSEKLLEGFITFVHINNEGKSEPHGLTLELETEEELLLNQQAQNLT